MSNEVIDIKKNELTEQEQQLKALKDKMHEAIDSADGIILFAFKNEEVNGQTLPKSLFKDNYGFVAFGNSNFHYANVKTTKIIEDLNKSELQQRAALSE